MTLQQLKDRVKISTVLRGQFKIYITYKNHEYWCYSNNTLATDDYKSEEHRSFYKTDKQCLMAMYDECMRKNHLGKYNY